MEPRLSLVVLALQVIGPDIVGLIALGVDQAEVNKAAKCGIEVSQRSGEDGIAK